ncbi:MAG: ABC transporter permease YtrF precursor [candidate division BRC1 bacterium ADurb.BinA364]|nr:MAG: ABC transporter permease YtrF precursor [candidate division BRC1 bacterium ADurb.BinA364]
MIPEQIKLPAKIAFDVAMQGMRIRFGRSVVTIMGVVLGIAFLMSILTSQSIRKGVSAEDEIRKETSRMANFLRAEMGPAMGRTIAIVQTGPLNEPERRLLLSLEADGLEGYNWTLAGADSTMLPATVKARRMEPLEKIGADVSALVLIGAGAAPGADWAALLANARQKVVATTRASHSIPSLADISVVALNREPKPDEIARAESEARKASFRNGWIIVISLAVTVIGIANAMLMSVTERFREIGTMKCLGALSAFVRRLFLIESSFMGVVGGALGGVAGALFSIAAYGFVYGFGLVAGAINFGALTLYFALALVAGVILSIIAAIYPASVASRMAPADALRTNI